MKIKSLIILTAFFGAIFALFICFYFYTFHKGFSSDSQAWGSFGSYIGGVSTFVLSILAMIVSWNIHIRQEKHDKSKFIISLIDNSFNNIDLRLLKYVELEANQNNPNLKFEHLSEQELLKMGIIEECCRIEKCIKKFNGESRLLEVAITSINEYKKSISSLTKYQNMKENVNYYLTEL